MTDIESIIRPIVEGQLRGFLKEHPSILDCVGWFKPKLNKTDVFVNSLAKRIINDLASDLTVGKLRDALVHSAVPEHSSEAVAKPSAAEGSVPGNLTGDAVPSIRRVDIYDGKYSIILTDSVGVKMSFLRYGNPWQEATEEFQHVNFIWHMAEELYQERNK